MENKHQFRARVRNTNYEYLEDYRDNHDLANIGEALDKILEEHKELYNKHWDLQYISITVAQTVQQEMKRDIKKLMMGINHTDFNTQVLIELLQGFMVACNKGVIAPTNMYRPPFLDEVEGVVKDRIANQKQRK